MNEEEKNNAAELKMEAESKPEQLSPRRRTALVTYLAILFAVAFLFVALMMVFEAKRLKTMNQELQDSSQKTSASLTNNINALQAENQQLSKQNEDLNNRVGTLESEAAQKEERIEELQTKQEADAAELARLEQALNTLEEEKSEAEQRAQEAVRVSELLHKALAADEKGRLERLQELLDEIEPLQDLLSETEREIYEELKIA